MAPGVRNDRWMISPKFKSKVKAAPIIGPQLRRAKAWTHRVGLTARFAGSTQYWDRRYRRGGTSGSGSYGHLAKFKAEVVNRFVADRDVSSVIEFGCGDGNQLSLARYPNYVGLDVSASAIDKCARLFAGDSSKNFVLYDPESGQSSITLTAELALSLDVVYHLIEDQVFDAYMRDLFAAANRYVIVYSSNEEDAPGTKAARHVRHRRFTDWVQRHQPGWRLTETIDNEYPYDPVNEDATSKAKFFIFEKAGER